MGDGEKNWSISGKCYTPIDVAAFVLRRLKQASESFLGTTMREAVITVPAYFNTNQKEDTKRAGEDAGLTVLKLLPEPTAAAIAYGLDKGKDQTIMVYDLGGGTFDVSILRVKDNKFTVIGVDGDSGLGGDDFDLALVEYLTILLQKRAGSNVDLLRTFREKDSALVSNEILSARQRLKETAEKAKIELSQADSVLVAIPEILGTSLDEEITIATYNKLISPLVDCTVRKIWNVLSETNLKATDIDRVILVGGSTRNRLVKERIADTIKEPWTSDRVDEAVAQGAAIVAASMALPDEELLPIEFKNVTPFSLGVRASTGTDRDLFQVLIPKNTPIPVDVSDEFTTFRPNQRSVEIAVFQGERTRCRENTFVGSFRLEGIPAAPAGQPQIAVRFHLDDSDLLTVSAACSNLRSEQTLDVNFVSREDELPSAPPQVDIIFWVDTSGSMAHELDGVKRSCLDFTRRLTEVGIDCRVGLVDFAEGAAYQWEVFGPMDPAKLPSAIARLSIGRLAIGGCYVGAANTIPVTEAYVKAFPHTHRSKVGILISDEVGNDAHAIRRIVDILQQAGVCLHVVGVANSCHELLARETGGRFWDIHASRGHIDFSDLLDSIAVEITNLALR
jgi:molecular chaperone DnaK (HSP70)